MVERTVRSKEWRRKHSIAMHKIATKLLRLKKLKAKHSAKKSVLKKRAEKLALALIRKKFSKKSYNSLSTSQKMALDRTMKRVTMTQVKNIAKKLLPIVTKHEHERVKKIREEVSIFEAVGTDFKRSIKQQKTASISKHRRTKRGSESSSSKLKGESPGSHSRLKSRTLRKALEKRYGAKGGGKTRFAKIARIMMMRLADNKTAKKRIGDKVDKEKKTASNFNRSDMSKTSFIGRHKNATGGGLYTSYEYDALADMILEGNMARFHALFLRGLVDKSKIEVTKRIFGDLDRNIKFRRFQDDIVDMLEKLVKLITQDDTIYNKITQKVQRKHHRGQ